MAQKGSEGVTYESRLANQGASFCFLSASTKESRILEVVVYALTAGAILGLFCYEMTRRLIQARVYGPVENPFISGKRITLYWMVVFSVSFAFFSVLFMSDIVLSIECMILFSIFFCLSVTDIIINKIPNELLLFLIINKLIFVIINSDFDGLLKNIAGMVAGLLLFIIPVFFGANIGMGDVKFAAVIGLYLGFSGLLQTVIIMAAGLAAYTVYLYAAKKGSLKTSAAIGPYLSAGAMISAMYPLISVF